MDEHELQEEADVMPSESARRPKSLPSPSEPSKQERDLHELTHLPFRIWCEHCVQAKGKHSPHPSLQDRRPVIQIDFAFLTTKEHPTSSIAILTGVDVRTQLSMGAVVPSKGVNRYGLT